MNKLKLIGLFGFAINLFVEYKGYYNKLLLLLHNYKINTDVL